MTLFKGNPSHSAPLIGNTDRDGSYTSSFQEHLFLRKKMNYFRRKVSSAELAHSSLAGGAEERQAGPVVWCPTIRLVPPHQAVDGRLTVLTTPHTIRQLLHMGRCTASQLQTADCRGGPQVPGCRPRPYPGRTVANSANVNLRLKQE